VPKINKTGAMGQALAMTGEGQGQKSDKNIA